MGVYEHRDRREDLMQLSKKLRCRHWMYGKCTVVRDCTTSSHESPELRRSLAQRNASFIIITMLMIDQIMDITTSLLCTACISHHQEGG